MHITNREITCANVRRKTDCKQKDTLNSHKAAVFKVSSLVLCICHIK